jgi:hypothetical protein
VARRRFESPGFPVLTLLGDTLSARSSWNGAVDSGIILMSRIGEGATYWLTVCLAGLAVPSFLVGCYGALFGPDFLARFYLVGGGLFLGVFVCARLLAGRGMNGRSAPMRFRPFGEVVPSAMALAFIAGIAAVFLVGLVSFLTWHYTCWLDGSPTPTGLPVFDQPPPYSMSGASGVTQVSRLRYLIARTSKQIFLLSAGVGFGLYVLYRLLYRGNLDLRREPGRQEESRRGA